ncbi:hypothetical protein A2U01_0026267, partial [Trifolium medium]|nr:hypothetical protein [Trifolium medium]
IGKRWKDNGEPGDDFVVF